MNVKFYHWNTKLYNVHIITDNFLAKLNKHIDKLVEVAISYKLKLKDITHYFSNFTQVHSNDTLINDLELINNKFLHYSRNDTFNNDIQAIFDEISIDNNRFKYLLFFK